MKTVQKIINKSINENVLLNGQLIKISWVIFEDNQFMSNKYVTYIIL